MMPERLWFRRQHGPLLESARLGFYAVHDDEIGRSIECQVCLPDPGVSRRHASVAFQDNRWFIVDQNSTAGTCVHGDRIESFRPVEIREGDAVDIGPWRFLIGNAETESLTVAIQAEENGRIERLASGVRLKAMDTFVSKLGRCRSTGELADASIEAAVSGTVYRRGVVLYPLAGERTSVEVLAACEVDIAGKSIDFDPLRFTPSSQLLLRAMEGSTAFYVSKLGADATLDQSMSLVQESSGSAICVPVHGARGIDHLIYLDTPLTTEGIGEPAAFCENIATLFAYAVGSRANAELAERQRSMQIEFELAEKMRVMLSQHELSVSELFKYAYHTEPGMFVSADFFSVIHHDDGAMDVVFGDGAGHGIGASILSTLVHSHLVALLEMRVDLAVAAEATNRFLAIRETEGRFVSLMILRFEPGGTLHAVDAGHGHWYHVKRSVDGTQNEIIKAERARGVPLGIDPDARFECETMSVCGGDRLVLYTDGIPEQRNINGVPLGDQPIIDALRSSDGCGSDIDRVIGALGAHRGEFALEDDATIASIEVL